MTEAVARNHAVASASIVPAYWFDDHLNFGDALTPWLLSRYGFIPVLTRPGRAQLAGVGSILELLPTNFDGAVWGSGLLSGKKVDLPRAKFLAVRGPLTRSVMGISAGVALGDPGLLVGQHIKRPSPRWKLGIVLHGLHRRDVGLRSLGEQPAVHVIDALRAPGVVLREIAACEAVLSTSLHGLITADSFGVPAAWTQREPLLWGADFKFRDYEAVVTPGRSREITVPGSATVSEITELVSPADSAALTKSIAALEGTLEHVPVVTDRPWRAFSRR